MKLKVDKLIFAVSCIFLAFILGVLVAMAEVWPYSLFKSADLALKTHWELLTPTETQLPKGAVMLETTQNTKPFVAKNRLLKEAAGEKLLVFGGPDLYKNYCPDGGCVAWLMDRQGRVLHTWQLRASDFSASRTRVGSNSWLSSGLVPMGGKVFPNGNLLVNFQGNSTFPYGVATALYDKDSRLIWRKENSAHHWGAVTEQGIIYQPEFDSSSQQISIPQYPLELTCGGPILKDFIGTYTIKGQPLGKFDLVEMLADQGWGGLLFSHEHVHKLSFPFRLETCDPLHLNFVEVVPPDADGEILRPGDLIVSLRKPNAIIVIDPQTRKIKHVLAGRTVHQHSPRYLREDKILVFDNLGGSSKINYSRLLEIDLKTQQATEIFPRGEEYPNLVFASFIAGFIDLDQTRSRALVSLTTEGVSVEIDLRSKDILWQYVNTHPIPANPRRKDVSLGEQIVVRAALNSIYYVNNADFKFNQLQNVSLR